MCRLEECLSYSWYGVAIVSTLALMGCAEHGASIVQDLDEAFRRAAPSAADAEKEMRWARIIEGADETVHPHKIEATSDGYRIVATGEQTVFVVEMGANGDIRSQRAIGVTFTGNAMDETDDGGFIFAGTRDGDMHLLKTDADGNREWELTHGGEDYDSAASVQQTRDGGYIVTGERDLQVMGELALWKVDRRGELEWSHSYVDESAYYSMGDRVREVNYGYIVAGGGCLGDTPVSHELYVVRTDDRGNLEWQYSLRKEILHEFSVSQGAYDIQRTSDGGYVIAGGVWIPPTISIDGSEEEPPDAFPVIVKLDADGNSEWKQSIERTQTADVLRTVRQTADGGFILVGSTAPREEEDASQMYLVKLGDGGAIEWQRSIGATAGVEGVLSEQTADGGFLVAGAAPGSGHGGIQRLFVVKTDAAGNPPEEAEAWR